MWTYFKNVCLGGTLGLASGFCFNRYTKISSLVGLSFVGLKLSDKVRDLMDVNRDGNVNSLDIEMIEEKLDVDINWFGIVSYVGGFGVGYMYM